MHINTRRLIAAAFILAFLIAAPILVLYTAGLRWNFKKWSWQKTGSIYIEVEPKDADILINGKKADQKIPAIINALTPDDYNIKIEKENYISWERNIEVLPEKTSIIKNIILLPKNIKRQKEIIYSSNDSPVVKSKEGSLVYAENIWKFELGGKETSEIIATDDSSFTIFKDGQNSLIIGSIADNVFSKIDYLKNAGDFYWNENDQTLTVSDELELLQYEFGEQPIKKSLIIRSSSGIDRILPIQNSSYTMILQNRQIKIAEHGTYGAHITPLIDLEADERFIFWEMNKKFNISIWTQTGENLQSFEINLLK